MQLVNMISKIKNSLMRKKSIVLVNNTNYNKRVLKFLLDEGFIEGFKILPKYEIKVFLKYHNEKSVIRGLELVSKPSRRIYVSVKELKSNKYQNSVVSTSRGILRQSEAIRKNIGGQVILKIF